MKHCMKCGGPLRDRNEWATVAGCRLCWLERQRPTSLDPLGQMAELTRNHLNLPTPYPTTRRSVLATLLNGSDWLPIRHAPIFVTVRKVVREPGAVIIEADIRPDQITITVASMDDPEPKALNEWLRMAAGHHRGGGGLLRLESVEWA